MAVIETTTATEARQETLFAMLAEQLNGHIKAGIDESSVRQLVEEEFSKRTMPQTVVIKTEGKEDVKLEDAVHQAFFEIIDLINEGAKNILLVGPAGTGKTTLAKQVAKALGRMFGMLSLSAGVTETHFFGRLLPQRDGTWEFSSSQFVNCYENGGVFLLDEMDAADPNVLVSVNAALANGQLANPNGMIHQRHPNTIIIAAANTYGRGADAMYVGRNSLDAATLDRFCLNTLSVDYDTKLESLIAQGICGADLGNELCDWVNELRKQVSKSGIRRVVSTRLIENGARALANGKTLGQVKSRFFAGWTKEELNRVNA